MQTLKDSIPIVLSIAAFGFSLWAFRVGGQRDKRDLFLRLHERLIDPELQEGRKALYTRISSIEDARRLETEDPHTYALIGRALAMFDIFGLYAQLGYIDKRLALKEWGQRFAMAYERSRPYLEHRDEVAGGQIWPNLRAFGAESTSWAKQNLPDLDVRDANNDARRGATSE